MEERIFNVLTKKRYMFQMMAVLINIKGLFTPHAYEWKHLYCTHKYTVFTCKWKKEELKSSRGLILLESQSCFSLLPLLMCQLPSSQNMFAAAGQRGKINKLLEDKMERLKSRDWDSHIDWPYCETSEVVIPQNILYTNEIPELNDELKRQARPKELRIQLMSISWIGQTNTVPYN